MQTRESEWSGASQFILAEKSKVTVGQPKLAREQQQSPTARTFPRGRISYQEMPDILPPLACFR